jgi:hypothetical protein
MVDLNADASATATAVTSECAHHWRIETPSGEMSKGICKHCGATRTFANYSERKTMTRAVKPAAGAASNQA